MTLRAMPGAPHKKSQRVKLSGFALVKKLSEIQNLQVIPYAQEYISASVVVFPHQV